MASSTESLTESLTEPLGESPGGVALEHRKVQREQDARDRAAGASDTAGSSEESKPVQAGHRPQPENPMPAQHLKKPGLEADMDL